MRRYAVLNVARVLFCIVVTAIACSFLYPRLFRYEMVAYIVGFYAFSFVPRPNVPLLKRLVFITLAALAFGLAYMFCNYIYNYLTFGILPPGLREGDVAELRYPLGALFFFTLGPHYFVFVLSYVASDLLVMKRVAPAPSSVQGVNGAATEGVAGILP